MLYIRTFQTNQLKYSELGNISVKEVPQTEGFKAQGTMDPPIKMPLSKKMVAGSQARAACPGKLVKNHIDAGVGQPKKSSKAGQQVKPPDKPKHLPLGQGHKKQLNSPRSVRPERGTTKGMGMKSVL